MVKNLLGVFLLLLLASVVYADDAYITTSFGGFGVPYEVEHQDAPDPISGLYMGKAIVTVTNNDDEAWGDFHFEIFQTVYPVNQVYFRDASFPGGVNPSLVTISGGPHSLDSYVINNPPTTVGATMDLYYYSNPVLPGETVKFTVFTDNTATKKFFGLAVYPTPVPEPMTMGLLALGGLFAIRRKK